MEKNLEKSPARDLCRGKENCPSGYQCRTRHTKGVVSLSRGLLKERGPDVGGIERSGQEGTTSED